MWLNILILVVASIAVGFILGWVAARPRRWDYVFDRTATITPAVRRDSDLAPVVSLTTPRP